MGDTGMLLQRQKATGTAGRIGKEDRQRWRCCVFRMTAFSSRGRALPRPSSGEDGAMVRRSTAAALGDAEFHAVWEVSPEARVLSNAAGIVVDANPAYLRLYGLSAGAARTVEVSTSFLTRLNGEVLAFSIVRDITARQRRDDDHKDLERRKDEFLTAAAHDLNNPLTAIKGYEQLLRRRLERDAGSVDPFLLKWADPDRRVGPPDGLPDPGIAGPRPAPHG